MRNVFITTVAAMAISTAAFAEDTVKKNTDSSNGSSAIRRIVT